jgi:SAM-dependent methyltransferase
MVAANCCICGLDHGTVTGNGEDFEYHTSADVFTAKKCDSCDLVYLNPRPDISEFAKIYPPNYHAFNFSQKEFRLVFKIRQWVEIKRLLDFCKPLKENANILDAGCGDGFHLQLLEKYGNKTWHLEGIDMDARAIDKAEKSGLKVHHGDIETADLPQNFYDLVFTLQTIEHLANPDKVLANIYKILKPGGRLVIVTDNTDSLDFKITKKRYWGGYHFPRHWYLFNKKSMRKLAQKTNFKVEYLGTQCSPVNWVYTIHNWLVDRKKPAWMIRQFTLKSVVSLSFFTALDFVLQKFKKGALLRVYLQKPL